MGLGRFCAEDRAAPYRGAALAVAVGYVVLATGYALKTPAWQIPDEPAHFNYVSQVARFLEPESTPEVGPGNRLTQTFGRHRWPRIEPGDYPFEQLEFLKARRFGGSPDIEGIEYEDHQPPLYYAAVAVVDLASADEVGLSDPPAEPGRRLTAVRLLGVIFGAVSLIAAWKIARLVAPGEPAVAVGAAAFVAFLPMNLTMTGAANNDALATPVAALLLLAALQRAVGQIGRALFVWQGGLLLGIAYLTKVTLYPLTAVVLVGGFLAERRQERVAGAMLPAESSPTLPSRAWGVLGPAVIGLLIALPWFVRDARVYGATDPLGLQTHNAIVVGQPLTADWIAEHGLVDTLQRLAGFTFESFWGVFGWMGVFLAPWAYGLMALATIGAVLGVTAAVTRRRRERRPVPVAVVVPLGLAVVAVFGGFLFYNLTFVQHQGRYLFPALVPIALVMSGGFFELGRLAARTIRRRDLARCAGALTVYAGSAALALLAYLSLARYVIPGLAP